MTDSDTDGAAKNAAAMDDLPVEMIADLVKRICLTFSEVALYSWDHPSPKNHLESAWEHLHDALQKHGDIAIHSADGRLMFAGIAMEDKNPVVRRLSHHFEAINVSSLTFKTGLQKDEFDQFFHIFSMEKPAIDAAGGIPEILQSKGITHIRTNAAVYKLITEDEKIVSADSVVVDRLADGRPVNDEVIRYFTQEVLQKSSDQEGLLRRLKTEPMHLADQIVGLLQDVDNAHDNLGQQQLMNTLMTNIELVGQSIAQAEGSDPAQQGNMAKSLMSLEMELERKGKGLASAGATKFLKRVTNIVSSYADTSRAEAMLTDFVENERSLKSAESMLNEISGDAQTSRRLLERLKGMMNEKQVEAEELLDMIEKDVKNKEVAEKQPGKRKRRRTNKTFRPIAERIKPKIRAAIKGKLEEGELLLYLGNMFNREVTRLAGEQTEKARHKLEAEAEAAREQLRVMEALIGHTQIGFFTLAPDGTVASLVNGGGEEDVEIGRPLPEKLAEACRDFISNTIMTYGSMHILEVERGAAGRVRAVMFVSADADEEAGISADMVGEVDPEALETMGVHAPLEAFAEKDIATPPDPRIPDDDRPPPEGTQTPPETVAEEAPPPDDPEAPGAEEDVPVMQGVETPPEPQDTPAAVQPEPRPEPEPEPHGVRFAPRVARSRDEPLLINVVDAAPDAGSTPDEDVVFRHRVSPSPAVTPAAPEPAAAEPPALEPEPEPEMDPTAAALADIFAELPDETDV